MGKTQTLDELAMSKQYIVIQELIRSDQIPNDRVAQLINSYPDQARWLRAQSDPTCPLH
jgi:hypothetical protein